MKRLYTFCVVSLVLSSLILSAYAQDNRVGNEPPDSATWMPDANLRNAVRAALHLNANEPLIQQKLLNLNVLNAPRLGITDLTGLEYATNLRSLSVGGNQISDLTPLANLTRLTALYIGDNPISDITPLVNLTNLRRLGMLRNQITDIRILADLVNLTYLRLAGNPITDMSPLGNLPNLSDVDIEISSLISNANLRAAVYAALGIEPNLRITIDAMRSLTTLNLNVVHLKITDLTGLEYATNLTHLYLRNNLISDLTPLAHLTNLRTLSVGGNQISDLTPLANLTSLTALYIGDNLISDITPLANLTNLRRLGMLRNQVTDINVLAGLVNLQYLRLAGNPITNPCPLESLPNLSDVDIEIPSLIPDANLRAAVRMALGIEGSACITIEAMQDLTTLNATHLGITDLTGLEYATNLKRLHLRDNLISDIAPLAHLTNLRVLSVGGNQISDLTPLANLIGLTNLDMGDNLISDIAPLAHLTNLRALSVGGNQISDLTPLASLIRLTGLYIEDNLISDITPLANLTNLRRLGMIRNQVTDINVLAGLVNLEYLRLAGNPITDMSPLRSLPKLTDVDVDIFPPPQKENTQPQGESTHFDTDPPQDDGQQKDDRRQDDSGQSQQQQSTTNPQDDRRQDDSGQSQQQQSTTNPQPQSAQQQQPTTNPQPTPAASLRATTPQQQSIEPDPVSAASGQDDEEEEEDEEEDPHADTIADCEAKRGTIRWVTVGGTEYPICFRPATQEELDALQAPSHLKPKNAFILDRITLEQLDPATLEAQLDVWRAESDGSTLYRRSIALLESVLATRRPDKTHLLPNYPNPFNPETWIPYHLANPSEVQVTIYDTRGTVVRRLDLGHQQEGYYTSRSRAAYWDGCNDIGEKVSSGIYFYQFQADNVSLLRKMLILK